MGNFHPYSPSFMLYNTFSSHFIRFELPDGEESVDPFDAAIAQTCREKPTEKVSRKEVWEFLEKEQIDGFKFRFCSLKQRFRDQELYKKFYSKITYLEFSGRLPGDTEWSKLATYARNFPNLQKLQLIDIRAELLDDDFWKVLSGKKLKFLGISLNMFSDTLKITKTYYQVFKSCPRIHFCDRMWKNLLDHPELFRCARKATGDRILMIESYIVDRADLNEEHLKLFTSLAPEGHELAVSRMDHPKALSVLFKYLVDKKWPVNKLYIKWWPSVFPEFLPETPTLHFWYSSHLPVIKEYIQRCPSVKAITSGLNAATAAEVEDLRNCISRDIDATGISISKN